MATTTMTIKSERFGLTVCAGSSPAQTSSANWFEGFKLPVGIGDCGLLKISIYVNTIQTIVASPHVFGPTLFLISPDVRDFVPTGAARFTHYSSTAMQFAVELERPMTWYQAEELVVQSSFLDSGAGNTSIINMAVGVMRFRS